MIGRTSAMSRTAAGRELDAVVFDFYGTLADAPGFSFDIAIDTLLSALDAGLDRAAFTAAYRAEIGRYWRDVAAVGGEQHNTVWVAGAATACGRPSAPDDPAVVAAVDAYFDRYRAEIVCFDGTVAAVAELGREFRLGLVSNFTDPRPVRATLDATGLDAHFGAVVISAELGRRKPHRDIFAHALAELGAEPGRALYVGDDPVDDVAGAAAAGMRTAWIRRDHRSLLQREFQTGPEGDGAEPKPDYTVAGVAELVPLLVAD